MAKRNCPTLQKSLDWCEGMPSHPGVRRRVYFCNKNLIVAFPTLPRDEFGRPTSAVLDGNFELADGAYWQYLDINIDKSTVTSEPQGEAPSQTQLNKATFVHNGIDEKATAAAGWLNNSDNVYIYEDMPGKFRVLGNDKWRTLTTVNQDMGQGTNPASTTINVEVTDEVAAPFYNGSIETEDGTVMPETEAEDDSEGSEGSTIGATVKTNSLELGFGQTGQIEVSPEDLNWTFESSNSNIASVNGNGLVTAGRTTGNAKISCEYKGIEIKRIPVTVGIMQGEDPDPNDPETPSGEEDDGIFEHTILRTIDGQPNYLTDIPHRDESGWSVAFYGFTDNAHSEGNRIGLGDRPSMFIIRCEHTSGEVEFHKYSVINETYEFPANYIGMTGYATAILNLLPEKGWNAVVEDEAVARFDSDVNMLEFIGEGDTTIELTNGDQSLTVAVITASSTSAG